MVISECISAYWNMDMCIGIIQIWKGDTCNINTYMSTMTLLTGQPWPVKQWRYYIIQTLLHELGIFQRVTTSLTTAEWRNRIWYSRGLVLQFSAIIKKVSKRTNDAIKKWHSFFPIIALKAINSVLNHVTSYQSTRYLFSQVLLFSDELSNKRPSVSEVKSDDTGLKKMCLPPYLLSAYRYNAGIYASIVAYHARIAELNSSGATGDGTASASYKN